MQKYSKDQLTAMSREELLRAAAEFGIKAAGLDDMAIVYEILDSSAMASAIATPEPKTTRKRGRPKANPDETNDNKESEPSVEKPAKRRGRPPKKTLPQAQPPDLFTQDGQAQETGEIVVMEMTPTSQDSPAEEPALEATTETTIPTTQGEGIALEETLRLQDGEHKAAPAQKPATRKARTTNNTTPKGTDTMDEKYTPTDKTASQDDSPSETRETIGHATRENARHEDSEFIIIEDIPRLSPLSTHSSPFRLSPNGTRADSFPPVEPLPRTHESESPRTRTVSKSTYDFSNLLTASGLLEAVDNYGFLRSADYNYLPSPDDIYVSPQQIKQYALKTGDIVEGNVQPPRGNEHYFTLATITHVNGTEPAHIRDRIPFEFLTPLFPQEKFQLCSDDKSDSVSSRVVDLFAPIGKGQRALIVAQPKTGKTLLMKDIANSIAKHHPEAYLIMLLIDERPEEVTDMARTVNAEVIASTFDAPAENHVRIAGLVLEKAKRMVECGHNVVIFLDSITRLARAYNTVSPASGKILSGGVDANALQKPKRFFGAARNIENGGSLTIVATALIDTGSKMDEVIFEEFKGTGNMELQLDRTLANKRIFPAVNLVASSTRRDELLQDEITRNRMWIVRKHIADMTPLEAMDLIKGLMEKTTNNPELLMSINS